MAVLKPLSRAEIRREFTHRGWQLLCPVYIAGVDSPGMVLQERNGIPEWWLQLNCAAEGALIWCMSAIDPFWEPQFMVLVTGRIEG